MELDPDLFKIAQQDHGGWIDGMAEVRGYLASIWHWLSLDDLMYINCSQNLRQFS